LLEGITRAVGEEAREGQPRSGAGLGLGTRRLDRGRARRHADMRTRPAVDCLLPSPCGLNRPLLHRCVSDHKWPPLPRPRELQRLGCWLVVRGVLPASLREAGKVLARLPVRATADKYAPARTVCQACKHY